MDKNSILFCFTGEHLSTFDQVIDIKEIFLAIAKVNTALTGSQLPYAPFLPNMYVGNWSNCHYYTKKIQTWQV